MAKHGVLVESLISATNIDALQRSFKAEVEIDGGGVVSLTAPTAQGNNVWKATAGFVEGKTVAIAYNPALKVIPVNGKEYAGLSNDDRDYTNLPAHVGGAFIPQKNDEIVITVDDIVASTKSLAVAGNYLVPTASDFKWTAQASAPAKGLALKIEHGVKIQYPAEKGAIGFSTQDAVKAVVVAE